MTRELNRVTAVVLILFLVTALSTTFWAVIQSDSLLARPDNLRHIIAEQNIRRGTIVDQSGLRLAFSQSQPFGGVQRVYPYPEAAGAVGYYSFKYGTAGLENAFDRVLRGDNLRSDWQRVMDDALHRSQQGSDIRSTLDLSVQQAAMQAMGTHRGAVIAVHVPTGRILALASRPGYDPNRLDQDWAALTRNKATSPLLNRVTDGLYQPGGALQTVMLAAILSSYPDLDSAGGYVLNTEAPGMQQPVEVNGLTLTCLEGTPDTPLTLAEAYAYGCPAPFVGALGTVVTPQRLWERFEVLGLLAAPTLEGFPTSAGPLPDPLDSTTPRERLIAAGTGQGSLIVTPLQMAQIIAAIANRGNAVPFHLVDATRQPGEDWQPVELPLRRPALLREDVASAVRLAMLQAAAQSPLVSRARRGDQVMYGHVGLAWGGPPPTPYVWFTGFVDQTQGENAAAVVVVVVLEDVSDPGLAADVAGDVFEAVGAHPVQQGQS